MLDEKELRQNKANYKQLFDQILKYDEQLLSFLNEKQQLNTKLVNAVKNYFSYKLQLSNINLNALAVSFNASHYDLEVVNNVYILREYLRYGYISKMVNSRNRINEKIIFLHVNNTEEICDLMHSFLD